MKRGPWGKARLAAQHLREHGGSFATSAALFSVSRQAVQQSWKKLGFGEAPGIGARLERKTRILDLARSGLTAPEIAHSITVSRPSVYVTCRKAAVPLRRANAPDPAAIAAAVEMVRHGTSYGVAAGLLGVGQAAMTRYCMKAGVRSRATSQPTGRSEEAVLLMETEGMSVTVAAASVGVSPGSIRMWLKRRAAGIACRPPLANAVGTSSPIPPFLKNE